MNERKTPRERIDVLTKMASDLLEEARSISDEYQIQFEVDIANKKYEYPNQDEDGWMASSWDC